MNWQFKWRARCVRVIDGDTALVEIDSGFHTVHTARLRLAGVDTPETHRPTRVEGDAATQFTQAWMDEAALTGLQWPLIITTYKTDSFERYVAVIYRDEFGGESLNDALLRTGNAVPFMVDKITY